MLPYYVEPEYWVEGYAEGDAKIAGASVSASLTVSAAALRINDVAAAVACDLAAQFSAEIVRLASASVAADSGTESRQSMRSANTVAKSRNPSHGKSRFPSSDSLPLRSPRSPVRVHRVVPGAVRFTSWPSRLKRGPAPFA